MIIYLKRITFKNTSFLLWLRDKMPAQSGMQMPSSFGGLMRYNEEYKSPFMLTPAQVVLFIILVVVFVAALKIFLPIS